MIQQLEQYMLTDENLNELNKDFMVSKNNKIPEKTFTKENSTSNFFTPKEKDTLFWCYYYILFGNKDETFNKTNSVFKIEKDFKIDMISKIRENTGALKVNKLNIENVESVLANEECIDLETLKAMCLVLNRNIIYIKNRTYYHFEFGQGEFEIIFNDKGKHKVVLDDTSKYLKKIETYYLITNIKKPIGVFSSYKLNDLQDIASRLEIPIELNDKKKQKKILYNEIIEVII